MNVDYVIKQFGKSIHLSHTDGWESHIFNAFIQPLRYKNKLYMNGGFTPIGKNTEEVFLYLGPKEQNFCDDYSNFIIVDSEQKKYIIERAEKVFFKNEVIYIWAIIRKTSEV